MSKRRKKRTGTDEKLDIRQRKCRVGRLLFDCVFSIIEMEFEHKKMCSQKSDKNDFVKNGNFVNFYECGRNL